LLFVLVPFSRAFELIKAFISQSKQEQACSLGKMFIGCT